uniref:ShKT domain-containing protein n=1 Tax=Caenorhabditis tropicalis TaxID=1561998 RepID=A0A1I7UM68_9PELO
MVEQKILQLEMIRMLLIFIFCGLSQQAYPECSYDVCAKGGMWSEWTTTETCPTSCGSCSKLFFSRKCLSNNFPNCSCVGESSRYILCNTQPCAYPAQRACCIPYVPMLINKTMTCGPLPKDTGVSSESPCCPKGGLWTEWTGFAQYGSDKTWKRTRKCLSEENGCSCTNPTSTEETSTKCPCRDMEDVSAVIAMSHQAFPRNITYVAESCMAYQPMKYFNNMNINEKPCNAYRTHQYYEYAALIRYVTPQDKKTVIERRMFDCVSAGEKRATFYCDLKTLYWRLDLDNEEIYGFAQVNII